MNLYKIKGIASNAALGSAAIDVYVVARNMDEAIRNSAASYATVKATMVELLSESVIVVGMPR